MSIDSSCLALHFIFSNYNHQTKHLAANSRKRFTVVRAIYCTLAFFDNFRLNVYSDRVELKRLLIEVSK